MSTTDLDVVFVSDGLELGRLFGKLGELDVHGGAHASSEISRARGDVAEMLVVGESGLLLDLGSGSRESLEDLTDVRTLLHRDDTELILLVDPDEEGLGIVMEDTTSLGPLTLETTALKILVTTLEEEVIGDELLAVSVAHVAKGEVLALELTSELREGRDDLGLDLTALFSSASSSERIVSKVTGNSDSGGVDHSILISREVRALQLSVIHVTDVLVGGGVGVIRLDNLVEERSEGVETLVAASVNTDSGVGPFATGEDTLLESISILVFSIFAGIPHVTSENLGEKRLSSTREEREFGDLGRIREVRSHHATISVNSCIGHLRKVKHKKSRLYSKIISS